MRTSFAIPAGHGCFDGHFPGQPIVPAVVLLAEVFAAVEAATGQPANAWMLSSAKFLTPATPGDALTLEHEEAAGGARRFHVRSGSTLVASGTLSPRLP